MKTSLSLATAALLACAPFVRNTQAQTGGFELKNRSVFTSDSAHNPFWPIGWVKPNRAAGDFSPAEPAGFSLKPEDFMITSILLNEPALAVINGKAYTEGQLFVVNAGGVKVNVRIQSIKDGQVVLRYHGMDVVCQLRRNEPASHAAESIRVQESALDNSLTIPR